MVSSRWRSLADIGIGTTNRKYDGSFERGAAYRIGSCLKSPRELFLTPDLIVENRYWHI